MSLPNTGFGQHSYEARVQLPRPSAELAPSYHAAAKIVHELGSFSSSRKGEHKTWLLSRVFSIGSHTLLAVGQNKTIGTILG